MFSGFLRRLVTEGTLHVRDWKGRVHTFAGAGEGPDVAITVHDPKLRYKLPLNPELYLGKAYVDGDITVDRGSLWTLLELAGRNYKNLTRLPFRTTMQNLNRLLRYAHQFNPTDRARRNVAHHYDLTDELYELFLDRDRQYSCAYFTAGDESLEQAQANKKRHLAAKLLLQPGQRVLDIGSGWGGLALHLAETQGVDVTGLTLSDHQYRVSGEKAAASGLANRVRFHLRDYRRENGTYDRIVSVGMFEHVGVSHYRTFFEKIRDLLSDDGVAVIHSIGRMEPPGNSNPWLRRYIFPGGYTPALSEVLAAVEHAGLWVTDIEILRSHYALTLREWQRRFDANRDKARDLYDERFCRMWEYYLVGCEIAFRHLNQMVFQLQLSKRPDAVPITRDYITDLDRTTGRRTDMVA